MNKLLNFLLFLIFLVPVLLQGHIPNQSYIFLRIYENDGIKGRFEINTREVNKIYGTNFENGVTLKELEPYLKDLKAYLLKNTNFSSKQGNHKIVLKDSVGIFPGNLGDFVQVYFDLENTNTLPDDLIVDYSAVFEKDDTHKGFLITEYNWRAGVFNEEANISLDFGPNDTRDTLDLTDISVWKGFVAMIKQGIWHIWIGFDHILFLLALILPSVVRRKKAVNVENGTKTSTQKFDIWGWEPVLKFKPAFMYILKIVTFFTIAHTITLSLASLKIINLPSQFVESVIALSIGLAAYHNIKPLFKGKDWVIAFVFGLFHGFGFASVMADLGISGEFLTLTLLGFNLGVELGQVGIILVIFPILFYMRKLKMYPYFLVWLSVVLIIVSLYWLVERVFDINLKLDDYLIKKLYNIAVSLGLK
ncbi:HupE/UreJ family protein [uncultured Kriegella sp.]|uniref:HupE/UreJ family protein n=1 Tax=uncultured Kriegella sp. TaxID=1798910 RepID=UPI0030DD0871|tara:strand:+ start:112305 stop:113561 length:1257 start_codon:yes stop_codon:yes gene_type:complete